MVTAECIYFRMGSVTPNFGSRLFPRLVASPGWWWEPWCHPTAAQTGDEWLGLIALPLY